ncbi:MAG: META domain-containing protein [Bacteroidales bacterium]|jgi:heat shock protein HslJ|nr:META domain-containing protein [Bacteroidales bacterium]
MTLENFIIIGLIIAILSGLIIGIEWKRRLKTSRQLKIIYTLIIFICCICGCKGQKNITDSAGVSPSILDKEWVVIQIGGEKIEQLNKNQPPNLKLSENKISGYSSCNRFHGRYTMEENKITFSHIVITKMLCSETNDIESAYLKALSNVQQWKYKGENLYFLNQENQPVIILK